MESNIKNQTSFAAIKIANKERCETTFNHKVADWTPNDWAVAVAGEVGELCNLLKKERRGELQQTKDIADEIADVFIYLDLLATRLNINLEQAIISKFNEVSEKKGSSIFL